MLTLIAMTALCQVPAQPATIIAYVPTESCAVMVNGEVTRGRGLVRRFRTPALGHGMAYTYTIETTHNGRRMTKTVRVTPGCTESTSFGPVVTAPVFQSAMPVMMGSSGGCPGGVCGVGGRRR